MGSFHHSIDTALALSVDRHGPTMYIDLHGYKRTVERLELGYLLSTELLVEAYQKNNLSSLSKKSSLNNLLKLNPDLDFYDLLFGENAFGTLMGSSGMRSVPSMKDPHPTNQRIFSGGPNTRLYTQSSKHPLVFGFQIELHPEVRDTEEGWNAFAERFVPAYERFIKIHLK